MCGREAGLQAQGRIVTVERLAGLTQCRKRIAEQRVRGRACWVLLDVTADRRDALHRASSLHFDDRAQQQSLRLISLLPQDLMAQRFGALQLTLLGQLERIANTGSEKIGIGSHRVSGMRHK